MFDGNKDLEQRIEEEEQRGREESREPMPRDGENVPRDIDEIDEREARLRAMTSGDNKWNTKGLKPTTARKKIGIILLVAGLVGFLIIQYVLKGG